MSSPAQIPETTETEIPLTDRQWRERWALELTRANGLERRLAEVERDLSDWHCIALHNGERAARAEVDAERARADAAELRRQSGNTHQYLTKANSAIDRLLGELRHTDCDDHRVLSILRETIGVVGCECEGTGYVSVEDMVGAPGDSLGYRIESETIECPHHCWLGWVPR